MRVLWFTNTPANSVEYLNEKLVGGGWIRSLDKALQTKVELHVAFYYPRKNESFKYLDTTYHPITSKNWKLKTLKGIIWPGILDKQDIECYKSIINTVNPDVIHIHGSENPFVSIIQDCNIPVVVSIQGCITAYYHKFLTGFTKGELRSKWFRHGFNLRQYVRQKSFLRHRAEFGKMAAREQRNLQNAKNIIGRTAWDRRITSVLAPQSSYYHCDEMLRDVFFQKIWKFERKNKLIIHSTTTDNPYKGFETICQTLTELKLAVNLDVEWNIAGIYPESDILRVTKKKLGKNFPEKGLNLLGTLDENSLVEKLCEAHIYVSASHIENSPNSLCEAMLIGMPCIATFAGGTGSLIIDGEDGILIQDGDPWSLAGAILELYRNTELSVNLGMNARCRALIRHDKEKIINDLQGIYKQIAKTRVV